jgi:glucose/mannose-6-phosphate isomerase
MNQQIITHETAASNFHNQLEFALANYAKHNMQVSDFENVIIGGLGGSGIGGQLTKSWFNKSINIPVEVVSDYTIPKYVNNKSLVILCSYSGNTEETLSVLKESVERNATCLAISTGGALGEYCTENDIILYEVKREYQPRMALGFSFSFLMLILGELINQDNTQMLKDSSEYLKENAEEFNKRGMDILDFFGEDYANKYVFVAGTALSSVALRSCQQIQENAKGEAFMHIIPECNHNVIESYYGKLPTNFIFIEGITHSQTAHRFNFINDLLTEQGNKVYRLSIRNNDLPSLFELIATLDWLSIHLSNKKEVNNMAVPNIDKLKIFLSNIIRK